MPLNQAEDMVAAMQQTGTPYAYIVFEGEGHGFRRADSMSKATESELDFYGQVFGFDPADEIEPVEMVNFKKAESVPQRFTKRRWNCSTAFSVMFSDMSSL